MALALIAVYRDIAILGKEQVNRDIMYWERSFRSEKGREERNSLLTHWQSRQETDGQTAEVLMRIWSSQNGLAIIKICEQKETD